MDELIDCSWTWLPPADRSIPIHQRMLFSVQFMPGLLCDRSRCDCVLTSPGLTLEDLLGPHDGPYTYEAEQYTKRPPGSDSRYFR